MAGIYFLFVITVAVGSLMDCYVKGLEESINSNKLKTEDEL